MGNSSPNSQFPFQVLKTSLAVWDPCFEQPYWYYSLPIKLYITQFTNQGGVPGFSSFWHFFLDASDFWATIWSQHAQNIFLESLEVFLKIFKKIFFIPHFLKIFCPRMQVSLMPKISLPRGWEHPKIAHRPKNRFFQSPRYRHPNRTTEKKHQTNVSSALKTF